MQKVAQVLLERLHAPGLVVLYMPSYVRSRFRHTSCSQVVVCPTVLPQNLALVVAQL